MDDAPPPTEHTLRPHHVGLLTVFMIAFKELDVKKFPTPYTLHLYRVLLNEVSEVSRPKSHRELLDELSNGARADTDDCRELVASVQCVHEDLTTAEKFTNFFGHLPSLFLEKTDDEPPIFLRRSLFGYFCRRCFVSFLKLSFSGIVKLQKDYQAWCFGDPRAGYEVLQKGQLNTDDLLMYKTQADRKSWARPEAFETWEKGQSVGDENIAAENLRRFFEQHFHENNDSGYRQHALLNLARMHYIRSEYVAARKLLSEAVVVARTSGDRQTLQHCISLLHRLPPEGKRPVLNEIQPDLHPLEVLFDVGKLLNEEHEQPLPVLFVKLTQAVGLYDHWLEAQVAGSIEAEQWAQHAVQSVIWRAAGCDQIASIEEDVVVAFTEPDGEDSNRITVILNKAFKKARQGQYEKGLTMLLEPSVWRHLSLQDYTSWAHELWHILVLRTTRRGQDRLYREYLLPRRPQGPFNPKEYLFNANGTSMGNIRDSLFEVLKMRQYNQATEVVWHLLNALWHSEFLYRLNDYRTGIILLADIGLEYNMSRKCRLILEEIMPQIINGDDLEQRAIACFTLARCIIAAEDSKAAALHEAVTYLNVAESDFKVLQIFRSLKDVQYMQSVVYNTLGLESERDAAARRHFETEAEWKKLEVIAIDSQVQSVLEIVSIVGASLASR